MEAIVILIPFALIFAGIAYLVHSARKNKRTKTKEERRAQSISALIIIIILFIIVFVRQSMKQDRIDDVIQNSNTSQSAP